MEYFSFDLMVVSLMATVALREAMLTFLPARVVGPQGWLIRTPEE